MQENSPPCERGDTAEGGGGIPFPRPPCLPPLGEVPPQGAERVSPAKKKSPGGGIGD